MTSLLEAPISGAQPSGPATEWILRVLAQRPGTNSRDFARASKVSMRTVNNLISETPRPTVYSATYTRIMQTGPSDLTLPNGRVLPGAEARAIIAQLKEMGWGLTEIATASGLSISTLNDKNLSSIQANTLRHLMKARAVLISRSSAGAHGARHVVPAFRTIRRVNALMAQGWSTPNLRAISGITQMSLRPQRDHVLLSSFERVQTLFESLRYKTGPNEATIRRAKALGYAPWAAWNGDSIDDPDATPDLEFVSCPEWRESIRARYTQG